MGSEDDKYIYQSERDQKTRGVGMPHAVRSAVTVFRQRAERANFGQEYAHVIRANHKAPRPCSRESPVAMMSR